MAISASGLGGWFPGGHGNGGDSAVISPPKIYGRNPKEAGHPLDRREALKNLTNSFPRNSSDALPAQITNIEI